VTDGPGSAPGRVLVSGANGHLGRRLLRRLPRARALVRSERAAAAIRADGLDCEVSIADYGDAQGLLRAAGGCTRLVHLVGILKEGPTTRYEEAHEGASEALASAAAKAGIERIVYLSILGADPRSANACLRSKGRAEEILLRGPVPATVLRVPMVLGPGELACAALRRQAGARLLPLVRGGATLEQPIDAEDVVQAILAALERPSLAGRRIELAGPESLSHRALVMRCAAILGTAPRIVPLPLGAVRLAAGLLERLLANAPITRPMLEVLEHDDRIDARAAAAELGIGLTPLDETLRRCLGGGAEAA